MVAALPFILPRPSLFLFRLTNPLQTSWHVAKGQDTSIDFLSWHSSALLGYALASDQLRRYLSFYHLRPGNLELKVAGI